MQFWVYAFVIVAICCLAAAVLVRPLRRKPTAGTVHDDHGQEQSENAAEAGNSVVEQRRVLVTGVGGQVGRALVDQLTQRGVKVIGVDTETVGIAGVQTFRVPSATDRSLLVELRRLIDDHQIDLVLPTVAAELPLLASGRGELGHRADVMISDVTSVLLANDSLWAAAMLDVAGVGVPRFGAPNDFEGVEDALRKLGTPVVLKPRLQRGLRGVVVDDPQQQVDWDSLAATHILQEFVEGRSYAVLVFRAAGAGSLVSIDQAGAGDHSDVTALATAAVEALSLTGPVSLEIRRLADGRPVVVDVRPGFVADHEGLPQALNLMLAADTRSQSVAAA